MVFLKWQSQNGYLKMVILKLWSQNDCLKMIVLKWVTILCSGQFLTSFRPGTNLHTRYVSKKNTLRCPPGANLIEIANTYIVTVRHFTL
jgi:hypothetical protein